MTDIKHLTINSKDTSSFIAPWTIINGKVNVILFYDNWKECLCMTGGKFEEDESALETAIREADEETGFIFTREQLEIAPFRAIPHSGHNNNGCIVFFVPRDDLRRSDFLRTLERRKRMLRNDTNEEMSDMVIVPVENIVSSLKKKKEQQYNRRGRRRSGNSIKVSSTMGKKVRVHKFVAKTIVWAIENEAFNQQPNQNLD